MTSPTPREGVRGTIRFYALFGALLSLIVAGICGFIGLGSILHDFLRVPIGIKDTPTTGLVALAELVMLPALIVFGVCWVIEKVLSE